MKLSKILDLIHAERDRERYQREINAMTMRELDIPILRTLVNNAVNGAEIVVTLKDGTRLDIRREDPVARALARSDPTALY